MLKTNTCRVKLTEPQDGPAHPGKLAVSSTTCKFQQQKDMSNQLRYGRWPNLRRSWSNPSDLPRNPGWNRGVNFTQDASLLNKNQTRTQQVLVEPAFESICWSNCILSQIELYCYYTQMSSIFSCEHIKSMKPPRGSKRWKTYLKIGTSQKQHIAWCLMPLEIWLTRYPVAPTVQFFANKGEPHNFSKTATLGNRDMATVHMNYRQTEVPG